jgi:hypothetical protein
MSRRSGMPGREMPIFWVMIGLAALLAIVAYFGVAVLMPALAGAFFGWGAYRYLRADKRVVILTFAVEAGLLVTLLATLIANGGWFSIAAIEILIAILGTAWLLWRPGMGPLLVLGGINWFSVLTDFITLSSVPAGTNPWRLTIVFMILHVAVMVLSFICYRQLQRRADAALVAPKRKRSGRK